MDAADRDSARYIVALGNPGRRYRGTRHNVGFRVADVLHERWQFPRARKAFGGRAADGRLTRGGQEARVVLLWPHTYMNCSGRAVAELVRFYKAPPRELLVVLDDMELPLGRLRLRAQGSAGGHKGLDDVLETLGTRAVPRLRVGIGRPPASWDPVDYVLSRFGRAEAETIEVAIQQAADAAEDAVLDGVARAMERTNRAPEA